MQSSLKFIMYFFLFSMLLSENKYKEPDYLLLSQEDNIEIRQYNQYIVAKTSKFIDTSESENNMFRILASYIFGENEKNQKIPMTAPVTTYQDNKSSYMLFYMLDSDSISELPNPSGQDILFEEFNLGKCAVISFSWFVNDKKINQYQNKLEIFLRDNGYIPILPFMVNRYDPPWRLPFFRRNEVLVRIQ